MESKIIEKADDIEILHVTKEVMRDRNHREYTLSCAIIIDEEENEEMTELVYTEFILGGKVEETGWEPYDTSGKWELDWLSDMEQMKLEEKICNEIGWWEMDKFEKYESKREEYEELLCEIEMGK